MDVIKHEGWLHGDFISGVQQRGAAIITGARRIERGQRGERGD